MTLARWHRVRVAYLFFVCLVFATTVATYAWTFVGMQWNVWTLRGAFHATVVSLAAIFLLCFIVPVGLGKHVSVPATPGRPGRHKGLVTVCRYALIVFFFLNTAVLSTLADLRFVDHVWTYGGRTFRRYEITDNEAARLTRLSIRWLLGWGILFEGGGTTVLLTWICLHRSALRCPDHDTGQSPACP